jgi:telomerase reverse transcriptase
MKRKYQQQHDEARTSHKRQKQKQCKQPLATAIGETRPSRVLASCYPTVLSLRHYLIARLPTRSARRKRFLQLFQNSDTDQVLDRWRVGVSQTPAAEEQLARSTDFVAFTQTHTQIATHQTGRSPTCSLEEVLDFTIWYLFKQCPSGNSPRHVLCNGLQRGVAPAGATIVPGIGQVHPNDNLSLLKSAPWQMIFAVLGADGHSIFSGLLLDCGLFSSLDDRAANYYQVSGRPLPDLTSTKSPSFGKPAAASVVQARKPSAIAFVRNRMLYAKASLTTKGQVKFGLKHIHVFERCSDLNDEVQTIHIMKHMFPRQFGLHNVFTSAVDTKQTSQPFLDYIYREDEIGNAQWHSKHWLPPRLRHSALRLVTKIRKRHARCSYSQLLRHYCSLPSMHETVGWKYPDTNCSLSSPGMVTQLRHPPPHEPLPCLPPIQSHKTKSSTERSHLDANTDQSFLAHATPAAKVAGFCRAVLLSILPRDTFGTGCDGQHNWTTMLRHVDSFIKMRRFETLTLHQVCQRLRLNCIAWLCPRGTAIARKMSQPERKKRLELLWELVYYVFDSYIIPLIQSNFYVTESGPRRNHVFFFRHDVWRKLAEPNLSMLKQGLYQELTRKEVRLLLGAKSLGYSNVRLLPKDQGTRTITNLRRRMMTVQKGRRVLGPSINAQLAPVFSALNFERNAKHELLGSAIMSVGGLHEKIVRFKTTLDPTQKLYFVKVDIQSCFDSMPQGKLLEDVTAIVDNVSYRAGKYAETKVAGYKMVRTLFAGIARPADEHAVFSELAAAGIASTKKGRVFSEVGFQKIWGKHQLLGLIREHLQNNIVKIGKKHFRQKEGIPQGSVLSSLLCSLFYTGFEQDSLPFLNAQNSLLVRLIDDFLLISTDKTSAQQFLTTMVQGNEAYGIAVNPQKTLVNFEATAGQHKIPRCQQHDSFPYCGLKINTQTLQISKDRQPKDAQVSNGLTVEVSKKAGLAFTRKVRHSFMQQMKRMLLDGNLNNQEQLLSNMLEAYAETALKMHAYIRCMPPRQRPRADKLVQVVEGLLQMGLRCSQRVDRSHDSNKVAHCPRPQQVAWALSCAFQDVLGNKQTQYAVLLGWLAGMKQRNEAGVGIGKKSLQKMLLRQSMMFRDYVY